MKQNLTFWEILPVDDLPVRGVHLLAHRTVRGRRAALRPALCAHPSLPALRGVKGWSTRSR